MATSSIFKPLTIQSKRKAVKLLRAMELAQASKPKPVKMSRPVHDMTAEEVREVFGGDAPTRRDFPFKP